MHQIVSDRVFCAASNIITSEKLKSIPKNESFHPKKDRRLLISDRVCECLTIYRILYRSQGISKALTALGGLLKVLILPCSTLGKLRYF